MPLSKGKSKEAFKKNVATEIAHGKPAAQAVAIAHSVRGDAPVDQYGKPIHRKTVR